jgi:hypothetical protein
VRSNDHPLRGWLGFSASSKKNKSTSALAALRLRKQTTAWREAYPPLADRSGNPPPAENWPIYETVKIYKRYPWECQSKVEAMGSILAVGPTHPAAYKIVIFMPSPPLRSVFD